MAGGGQKEKTFETTSAAETHELGARFGSLLRSGVCVALVGALGSGKSVLVRGICSGLGVVDEVLSPTFILVEEYHGRLPIVHIDLYRLEHEREIEDLGVFELFTGETVVLAEWGDRSPRVMAASEIILELATTTEDTRLITMKVASQFDELLESL